MKCTTRFIAPCPRVPSWSPVNPIDLMALYSTGFATRAVAQLFAPLPDFLLSLKSTGTYINLQEKSVAEHPPELVTGVNELKAPRPRPSCHLLWLPRCSRPTAKFAPLALGTGHLKPHVPPMPLVATRVGQPLRNLLAALRPPRPMRRHVGSELQPTRRV